MKFVDLAPKTNKNKSMKTSRQAKAVQKQNTGTLASTRTEVEIANKTVNQVYYYMALKILFQIQFLLYGYVVNIYSIRCRYISHYTDINMYLM